MQKLVSLTGTYSGDVQVYKDAELSGQLNNISNKSSFNKAHVLKLFQKYPTSDGIEWKLYTDVVNAKHNTVNNG